MDETTAAGRAGGRPGSRINSLLEWAGLACLVGCAYLIWPPAALGVAGLVLVVMANMRQVKAAGRKPGPGVLERLARAAAVYRDAGGGR